MIPVPSATQWGSPSALKRAFLIHGNTCSSHTWETVAQGLAKAGFLVTAPNLLGHGHRTSEDFHLDAFARDLFDTYFADGLAPYDVIIGHSLGGTVTLTLLPLLSPKLTKTAVILVDPAIEFSDPVLDAFEAQVGRMVECVPSIEALAAANPRWTRQDVVSKVVGLHMAQSSELPKKIFKHIKPFAYKHLFSAIPLHIEMTVLIADPALSDVCPPELVPAQPQIRRVVTVKGSGHWIQHDDPEAIVRATVDEVGRLGASSSGT